MLATENRTNTMATDEIAAYDLLAALLHLEGARVVLATLRCWHVMILLNPSARGKMPKVGE